MISTSKRDVSHSLVGEGQRTVRRRRHRLASVAVAAILAETLVVSGSVTAVSASPVHSNGLPSASSSAFREGFWPWGSTISLNPYSPDFVPFGNLALFGLAAFFDHNRPGANPYYPEIAQSWTVGNHQITFNLQPDAVWQDGSPLTSTDVVNSMLVAGADFNPVWEDLTGVSAPNAHTVVVTLQPWAIAQTVLLRLFQFYIVPSAYYDNAPGQRRAGHTDLLEARQTRSSRPRVAAAANNSSSAGKAMSSFATDLAKYNPTTLDGNGAYKLVSATRSGVLYEKSSTFWDANTISAPWVQIYPMDLSDHLRRQRDRPDRLPAGQRSTRTLRSPELNHSQYGHYVFIPSAVQEESLLPHLADYPLGILQVRQALEYVIQRGKVTELDMGGALVQNPPTPYPDGINDFEADQYMTPAQFKTLNPYNYDPAKAASLLESVGFKKKGGTWYTPKGSPFTLYYRRAVRQLPVRYRWDRRGQPAQGVRHQCLERDRQPGHLHRPAVRGRLQLSENFQDWEIGTPMSDFAQTFGAPATAGVQLPGRL